MINHLVKKRILFSLFVQFSHIYTAKYREIDTFQSINRAVCAQAQDIEAIPRNAMYLSGNEDSFKKMNEITEIVGNNEIERKKCESIEWNIMA